MRNYSRIKLPVLLLLVITSSFSVSQEISPFQKIKVSGPVSDFVISGNEVVLVTTEGTIETYNLDTFKQTHFIRLPVMIDFMGDPVPTKVYSIDKLGNTLLITTQGNHGFRNVLILDDGNQKEVFSADADKLLVVKSRFVNDHLVLVATMSNELILYNLDKNEKVYQEAISAYSFSDFVLSENKQLVFTSDESGIVHQLEVLSGKSTGEFSGNNVDKVFKLVCNYGTILTAGQDRRVGVYQTNQNSNYFLQKNFLVYCVGLNKSATTGAFTADETNSISLFDIETRQETGKLTGHQGIVTKIEFINENTLVSASEDGYLIIWKL